MTREVQLVVEDELSGIVLQKLVNEFGNDLSVFRILQTQGYGDIKKNIQRYKNASNVVPHIVLTDLDNAECAPSLLKKWGVDKNIHSMLFRVAVREIEAWILADRDGFANYFKLPIVKIPQNPDCETDPKQTLFKLIRKCKKKSLIDELLPISGSRASIGPLYNSRMGSFVKNDWIAQRAIENSDSLRRAVNRIIGF